MASNAARDVATAAYTEPGASINPLINALDAAFPVMLREKAEADRWSDLVDSVAATAYFRSQYMAVNSGLSTEFLDSDLERAKAALLSAFGLTSSPEKMGGGGL